jgi:exonuclease III
VFCTVRTYRFLNACAYCSSREFAKNLDAKKPVIICGDLNVSHKEIDLKNPKTNTKNAGGAWNGKNTAKYSIQF